MASNKPIFWALFAAGGTVAALVAPVLIFITGFAVPLKWLESQTLGFPHLSQLFATAPIAAAVLAIISLFLWHAGHRLRVTAHDLGWFPDQVAVPLFYGLAVIGTLMTALLLFVL